MNEKRATRSKGGFDTANVGTILAGASTRGYREAKEKYQEEEEGEWQTKKSKMK